LRDSAEHLVRIAGEISGELLSGDHRA
jgi:hypothetical protein